MTGDLASRPRVRDESSRSIGLAISDVVVRYGGHTAVNRISLAAPLGSITGLIGPSGAGMTTTFNACSGLLMSPQRRAQKGMGRTFQRMELFDSRSVRENVALGREAGMAGSRPWRHLKGSRSDASTVADAVSDALEMCGHLLRAQGASLLLVEQYVTRALAAAHRRGVRDLA
jgi:ABC-type branched-subunit amino acid transport system ATPase component